METLDRPLPLAELRACLDRLASISTSPPARLRVESGRCSRTSRSNAVRRFRAALALARLDPQGRAAARGAWARSARFVAERLLGEIAESPSDYNRLIEAVRPVGSTLTAPLFELAEGTDARRSESAASVLIDLNPDRPEVLAPLAVGGGSARLLRLLPALERNRGKSMRRLRAELDRPAPLPSWEERPIPNDWASADPVAAGQIESAGGMVAERFAFCAAMPLEQVVAVAEALRPARYRPIRLRPYRGGSDGRLLASLAWTRDARPWRIDLGLTAASLAEAAKVAVSAGLEPVNLAGYRPGPKEASPAEIRYACVRRVRARPAAGFDPGLRVRRRLPPLGRGPRSPARRLLRHPPDDPPDPRPARRLEGPRGRLGAVHLDRGRAGRDPPVRRHRRRFPGRPSPRPTS